MDQNVGAWEGEATLCVAHCKWGEVFERIRLTYIRWISINENYSRIFAIILVLAQWDQDKSDATCECLPGPQKSQTTLIAVRGSHWPRDFSLTSVLYLNIVFFICKVEELSFAPVTRLKWLISETSECYTWERGGQLWRTSTIVVNVACSWGFLFVCLNPFCALWDRMCRRDVVFIWYGRFVLESRWHFGWIWGLQRLLGMFKDTVSQWTWTDGH